MSSVGSTVSGNFMLEPASVNNIEFDSSGSQTINNASYGIVSITANYSPEVLLVFVAIKGSASTVSNIVSSPTLTWIKLGGCSNSTNVRGEIWYALAAPTSPPQTYSVTVNLSSAAYAVLLAGGFAGCNIAYVSSAFTGMPIDPTSLASTPGSGTGSATVPIMTNSTVNPADFLIGFLACLGAPSGLGAGTNFTLIVKASQSTNVSGLAEYEMLTAANAANPIYFNFTTSEEYVAIAVGLMSGGNNTQSVQPASGYEWQIQDLFMNGDVAVSMWDGKTPAYISTMVSANTNLTIQVNNGLFMVLINPSATSDVEVGYDGVVTAV